MRVFFSILIFIAFALRPAIEISNVLYYQLNIDTIVEKYCVNKERPKLNCNGKCYLMTQMKMSKTTSDTQNSSLTVIVEAFIPLFFEDNIIQIKNISQFYFEDNSNWKPIHLHTKNVSNNIDRPPEVSFS
ncbi:hypothetical protein SAMN04487910_4686 [Aquimarina amphilecti]|uniref:Uncharacterized protein n=1 Tax=Aquimarina amphilecti TaxID=1038014 RepID=A0A1H7XAT2_AQUAM|nr:MULTISPECIES: hypothetical protein [Aquimarina]AXT54722.1 hypothetical protein D1815_02750 [Aquimarina sp. AD1]MBQ4805600.1 hypothetical protein [Aquimarina sp. MMG015]RKN19636.1 hypothetical protein D7035_13475 [Aquimarina sp. AD1]SEM30297.1 hypothetical protein SAMN04487910_4686 [Aquimarina amphilecti]